MLPDGCVDVIFDLGEVPERRGLDRGFLVGTMTRARTYAYTGRVDFLGVRFRPGVARSFVGIPVDESVDRRISLDDLPGWRDGAGRCLEALRREPAPERRLRILEEALQRRREPDARPPAWLAGAVAELVRTGGGTRIDRVADAVGVSRQHLARRFRREVGVPPKLFARIVRFRRVTEAARSRRNAEENPGWLEIAQRLDYYDQSHLIADFREFSGLSPERWLQRER